jgi:hypothetical protein
MKVSEDKLLAATSGDLQPAYEINVGSLSGPNISYALNVDLCPEAELVSIETKPGRVLADSTDITLNFKIPEAVVQPSNRGHRSFEVRFQPKLDRQWYSHLVLVASSGALFIYENLNYAAEIIALKAEVDAFYGLLEECD